MNAFLTDNTEASYIWAVISIVCVLSIAFVFIQIRCAKAKTPYYGYIVPILSSGIAVWFFGASNAWILILEILLPFLLFLSVFFFFRSKNKSNLKNIAS